MDTETKQQYWTEVTVPVYVAPSCVITCFVYVLPENGLWRHNMAVLTVFLPNE